MAFESKDLKFTTTDTNNHHNSSPTESDNYSYNLHQSQTDENRNENNCDNKEIKRNSYHSSSTQTIQKVDAATMTDPLRIDFRLTSEYLARCSEDREISSCVSSTKFETPTFDVSSNNCNDVKPKTEYDIEPQHINGVLIYPCPDCAYRFEDRESLYEHLEDHKQRPHICDICGASLKRKEHLDRHKQGHNKDRPYQCSMCCKAFKRNEHLARHMIIHSGSKNHICTECGKAFYRKDHLKKHLQSHNGTRGVKSIPDGHQQIINSQSNGQGNSTVEGLGNLAMMIKQAGSTTPFPSPFSIIRT